MICGIINVELRAISRAEVRLSLIIFHITKTESNNCFILIIIHFKWRKPFNNCFIINFEPKIINMARKTMQIIPLSASQ